MFFVGLKATGSICLHIGTCPGITKCRFQRKERPLKDRNFTKCI